MPNTLDSLLQEEGLPAACNADKPRAHRALERVNLRELRTDSASGHTVSVKRRFPVPVSTLWDIAGHPAKVSWAVPMLRGFRAPAKLRVGSGVAEVHTILGWPQIYVGRVTEFEPGRRWGMSNHPRGTSPFPLPHEVRYDFEGDEHTSCLSLTCSFRCGGLLALPFGPRIVAWIMKRALATMLGLLAKQVEGVSLGSRPDEEPTRSRKISAP